MNFNMKNISFNPFKMFNSEPKQKQQTMNFEKISALVGREITAENFSSLTAAELALVEGAVASVPATTPTATPAATNEPATATPVATPAASAEEKSMSATAIAEIVAQTMATTLAPIVQRLETLEGAPGASATEKPRVTETPVEEAAWNDPNHPLNKATAEFMQTGETPTFV